jgi:DNA-binding transcriptional ArsR family regulator
MNQTTTPILRDPSAYAAMADLHERTKRLLDNTRGRSGFAIDRSIALVVVNAGHGPKALAKLLADYSERYGAMTLPKAERYTAKLHADAQAFRAAHPPVRSRADVVGTLATTLAAIEALGRWHGHSASTDLEVLRALYGRGMKGATLQPGASSRTLAEQTGRTRKTVQRALGRLTADGYIEPLTQGKGLEASTYRLVLAKVERERAESTPLGSGPGGQVSGVSSALPLPEVFRPPDGLGATAYRMWGHLDDEPVAPSHLAASMGLSRRTVTEALLRLFSAGLALGTEGAWTRYTDDLDALAEAIGLGGHLARQRARHEVEREGYRRWLAAERPTDSSDIAGWLRYHRKHDLLSEARNAVMDPTTPALRDAQPPQAERQHPRGRPARRSAVRHQRRNAWAEAERAYQAALTANPANNRSYGSTYGGGPNGKRASRRTRKAPGMRTRT